MTKYGIQCQPISGNIVIGRLNSKNTAFLDDREDHSLRAVNAVAEHVLYFENGHAQYGIGDLEVEITVKKKSVTDE